MLSQAIDHWYLLLLGAVIGILLDEAVRFVIWLVWLGQRWKDWGS